MFRLYQFSCIFIQLLVGSSLVYSGQAVVTEQLIFNIGKELKMHQQRRPGSPAGSWRLRLQSWAEKLLWKSWSKVKV